MQRKVEEVILVNLMMNEEYTRKVIPFLKEEYFTDSVEKTLFKEINEFVLQYNAVPTKEALSIRLSDRTGVAPNDYKQATAFIDTVDVEYQHPNFEWLVKESEKFCQNAALTNAIMDSIHIIDGKSAEHSKDNIPQILSDALAVSFDHDIGHNYMEDAEKRYDFYNADEEKLPFDLDIFNKITKGGLNRKSLTCVLGPPGGGKTITLCHFAASYLSSGKNVLYITMEMAEERISERIDANLMNIPMDDMMKLNKDKFLSKINSIRNKTNGSLIVKEYPTAAAHCGHFKALIDELNLKKNFRPEIIIVDYLGICASARYKNGSNVGNHLYIKSVAEELRGLSKVYNVPVITAHQLNRSGSVSSDPGMDSTGDSFGIPATCDLFLTIITSEEMDGMKQIMFKQLKNRFNDLNYYHRFVVGIDKSRMKLYDIEDTAQMDRPTTNDVQEQYTPNENNSIFGNIKPKRDFSQFKI